MSTYTEASVPMCVNWHVTETCNYGCKHCFAKWGNQREVWNDPDQVEYIIAGIANHVKTAAMIPKRFRLNIVGGEPILQPEKLWNVVKTAKKYGAEVSMITNGSHLENIRPFAHLISQVGISIDSLDHETNMKIGRECCGKTICFEALRQKIEDLRKVNPKIKIKLNTVVNSLNFNEVLVERFAELRIDKWKILRQRPFNGNPGVSDFQFYAFIRNNYNESLMQANVLKRHTELPLSFLVNECYGEDQETKQVIYIEDKDAMTESYLMISPDGRLFQNSSEEYTYSRPLTEVSFAAALSDIKFDSAKFESRYATWPTQSTVNEMEYYFHVIEDDYDDDDCFMEFGDD